jgi:hypothetical protein
MAFTNYTIVPEDGTVVIDGQVTQNVSMAGISADVHAIVWNGVNGLGEIQYKQDPITGILPAPGSFTNPDDYYNQTQACLDPLVCYSTSNESVYDGLTFEIGKMLVIYQWPNPAVPSGFTSDQPPAQSLSYTSLFWFNSTFVWSLFDPSQPLDEEKSASINYVNSTAYSILQPTDWYVVRYTENGEAIPPQTNSWRQEIRDEAKAKVVAINATTTTDELLAYTTSTGFQTWSKEPAA